MNIGIAVNVTLGALNASLFVAYGEAANLVAALICGAAAVALIVLEETA